MEPSLASTELVAPRASPVWRVLALLAGLFVIGATVPVSLGLPILGALGVLVAARLARRRARPFTRGRAWLVAVLTTAVSIILAVAALLFWLPPGDVKRAWAQMSAQEPAPQPEWLSKIAPPQSKKGTPAAGRDPLAERLAETSAFRVYFGLLGGAIAVFLIGALFGTIGWAGALLIGFGATGRWMARATPAPLPGDERLAPVG